MTLVFKSIMAMIMLIAACDLIRAQEQPPTAPPMPQSLVLIVCKVEIAGPPDQNAAWTKHENLIWATEYSMMTCRRLEIDVIDKDAGQGAARQPFNEQRCQKAAVMAGIGWDQGHLSSNHRFWSFACPTPIVNKNPDGTEQIISWKMPECGHRDIMICTVDSEI